MRCYCCCSGTWYYDYTNGVQRIDRASGKNDRYCGSVDSADSPCQHLVVAGERYLVWPQLATPKCCGCCNSTQGCGIVKPTWMVDANGTWSGTAPFSGPDWQGSADSWEINGLQPNLWVTEHGTQTPVGFIQIPDDYQWFKCVPPPLDALHDCGARAPHAHSLRRALTTPARSTLLRRLPVPPQPRHVQGRPAGPVPLYAALVLHANVPGHQHLLAAVRGRICKRAAQVKEAHHQCFLNSFFDVLSGTG
jgi:hypothetical protein